MKTTKSRNARGKRESWQLQTAEPQLSEVFRKARTEGPQWVTENGTEAVVVIPR